jgi:hypothetical protein
MNNDLHATVLASFTGCYTFILVGQDLGLKKAYYPPHLADKIKYEMRMTSLTSEDIRTLYEIWIITVPAELLITGEDYSWDALIKL